MWCAWHVTRQSHNNTETGNYCHMSLAKFVLAGATAAVLTFASLSPVLAQEAPADPDAVAMQGNAFNPVDLVVPAGTTLTWVNYDGEDHDVVPSDPSFSLDLSFFSPPVAPGTAWSFTFTVSGTYAYMCDLHANMSGTITVQ